MAECASPKDEFSIKHAALARGLAPYQGLVEPMRCERDLLRAQGMKTGARGVAADVLEDCHMFHQALSAALPNETSTTASIEDTLKKKSAFLLSINARCRADLMGGHHQGERQAHGAERNLGVLAGISKVVAMASSAKTSADLRQAKLVVFGGAGATSIVSGPS